ncbi:hypothetical protein C8R47DRAFT_1196468 [Mycena vitilis]|nr:hypothetical protein C8R47DRAFT_1196468 [Mycena vitilis]
MFALIYREVKKISIANFEIYLERDFLIFRLPAKASAGVLRFSFAFLASRSRLHRHAAILAAPFLLLLVSRFIDICHTAPAMALLKSQWTLFEVRLSWRLSDVGELVGVSTKVDYSQLCLCCWAEREGTDAIAHSIIACRSEFAFMVLLSGGLQVEMSKQVIELYRGEWPTRVGLETKGDGTSSIGLIHEFDINLLRQRVLIERTLNSEACVILGDTDQRELANGTTNAARWKHADVAGSVKPGRAHIKSTGGGPSRLDTVARARLWTKTWIKLGHPRTAETGPGRRALIATRSLKGVLEPHAGVLKPGRICHQVVGVTTSGLDRGKAGVGPGPLARRGGVRIDSGQLYRQGRRELNGGVSVESGPTGEEGKGEAENAGGSSSQARSSTGTLIRTHDTAVHALAPPTVSDSERACWGIPRDTAPAYREV